MFQTMTLDEGAVRRVALRGPVSNRFAAWIAVVLVIGTGSSSSADTVFQDENFELADWTTTSFVVGSAANSSVGSQAGSGGNPGSYRQIVNTYGSGSGSAEVYGFHMKNDAIYNPGTSGAIVGISYSEDYLFISKTASGTQGQAAGLAVMQGGAVYIHSGFVGLEPLVWTNHSFPAVAASEFVRMTQVTPTQVVFDGNQDPDFSENGGPITFGFWRGNSSGAGGSSVNVTAAIDNWTVVVSHPMPVPASGPFFTFGLAVALGLAGLLGTSGRREGGRRGARQTRTSRSTSGCS